MSFGKQYLFAALTAGSVTDFFKHGDLTKIMTEDENTAYEFVAEFTKQYHALPDPETVEQHTGQSLVFGKEPAAFYVDLMRTRYTERSIKKAMQDASEFLKKDNKNPDAAASVLQERLLEIALTKQTSKIIDFRSSHNILMANYVKTFNGQGSTGLRMGWPTIDDASGGLVDGDLMSIVGRPAAGKTWQLMYAALYGWERAKEDEPASRLIVSMEMNPLAIMQRLSSLYTHLPAKKVKDGTLTTDGVIRYKKGLMEIGSKKDPLWILDGNLAATVEDIWAVAQQLRPSAIFVDGGYLVKHPKINDRYQRVAENADLMKKELASLAPTVVSWQFAKSANKKDKKKGEKVTMDDIGYTDAIAQVSSLVAGVFEDDSIETIKCRVIELLKGRNGETGRFKTNWDFHNMNFSEIQEQEVSALQFL